MTANAPLAAGNRDLRDLNRWAGTAEVAAFLGDTPESVRIRRFRGTGPPYTKHGRLCKYFLADVHRWMLRNLRSASS